MPKIEPTLAIGGADTEENEHSEVCPLSVYRSRTHAVSAGSLTKTPNAAACSGGCASIYHVFCEGDICRFRVFPSKNNGTEVKNK